MGFITSSEDNTTEQRGKPSQTRIVIKEASVRTQKEELLLSQPSVSVILVFLCPPSTVCASF